jgi:hypothetical protein
LAVAQPVGVCDDTLNGSAVDRHGVSMSVSEIVERALH